MTEEQKETLRFYTTNYFLLINGILWGENEATLDRFIQLINEDGRGVMKEALDQGFDVRWGCSKEEGDRMYRVYKKRFPVIKNDSVKEQIIRRSRDDIANMMACLEPLECELTLYRNIKTRFVCNITEGEQLRYLGFSSCSLNPHFAENAMYGSSDCTLFEIVAPAGTPAIRLDMMKDVQNEADEVILAPTVFRITKIDKNTSKVYMTVDKRRQL